jgi:hypothetical protein
VLELANALRHKIAGLSPGIDPLCSILDPAAALLLALFCGCLTATAAPATAAVTAAAVSADATAAATAA